MGLLCRVEMMWRMPDRKTWRPARDLLGSEAELVDAYLERSDLSCCTFQAGYFINVDGETWSDEYTVDEIPMTMIWFTALTALLNGETLFGPGYGPWEESRMTWSLVGDHVSIVEERSRDLPTMFVPLRELAHLVLDEGRVLVQLSQAIRAEVARRSPTKATAQRLATIDSHMLGAEDIAVIDELAAALS